MDRIKLLEHFKNRLEKGSHPPKYVDKGPILRIGWWAKIRPGRFPVPSGIG
jgi:hypothetical protein